jgi:hypothetical protein
MFVFALLIALASAHPTEEVVIDNSQITVNDPNVNLLTFPGTSKGNLLGFNYGNPAGSDMIAAFDFDGTLGNPLRCGGQVCPDDVWDGMSQRFVLQFMTLSY